MLLREIRKQKNLKPIEVAKDNNISLSHLFNIENGTRYPSIKLARKLAKYYEY